MGFGSPRRSRAAIGVAAFALTLAPAAWADTGLPGPAPPAGPAATSVEDSVAAVTATVSPQTQTAPSPGASVPAAAPTPSPPAAAQSAIAPAASKATLVEPAAGTRTLSAPKPPEFVGAPQPVRSMAGDARPALVWKGSRKGTRRGAPKISATSATPQVADPRTADGVLSAVGGGSRAPVPDAVDRVSRKRAQASAPAPTPNVPRPAGVSTSSLGGSSQGVGSVVLLAILAAIFALIQPALGPRLALVARLLRPPQYYPPLTRPG